MSTLYVNSVNCLNMDNDDLPVRDRIKTIIFKLSSVLTQQSNFALLDSGDYCVQVLEDAKIALCKHELSEKNRRVITLAACKQICARLESNDIPGALQALDMGLLLGEPLEDENLNILEISFYLHKIHPPVTYHLLNFQVRTLEMTLPIGPWTKDICAPTLVQFLKYFERNKPLKLTDCLNNWPALKSWKNWKKLYESAGPRLVPVEIGNYANNGHTEIMLFSNYLEQILMETTTAYMAQHRLFDQVPDLKNDILTPEYCFVKYQNDDNEEEIEMNVWIGPCHTVTPIHFDPRPNLLAQVVGMKMVTLFPASDRPWLYLNVDKFINTSVIDPYNVDYEKYPNFSKTNPEYCLLKPGDMLFIPKGVFHHVVSFEPSVSVNFWF